jgi:predicted AlkP superfamily phosphohydrolase/phosphomutase
VIQQEVGIIKKVIVLGLDGLDPGIVSALLETGQLPNLARLREQGGFARVATTRPAQTPVAWSTFATGTNPGGHGIFDFLRRDPKTYLPDFGLNRYEQKNAFLPPRAVNLRRGIPVWDILKSAGINSTILRCPCTFPPDSVRGRMLSGMGVPDLRGGLGTATFYTTSETVQPRESENVVRIQPGADGVFSTYLIGPRNPKARADLRVEISFRVDPLARRIIVFSDGAPKELAVKDGQWSDWLRVKFKLGLLQSIRGMVRFHLVRMEPDLAVYASPVNFDPEWPFFPISDPPEYAGDLAARIGFYHTTGMVEDHAGLNNERISEEAFLDQCAIAWRDREAMMLHELESFRSGLFYCLFDTPDRIQHLFWRFRVPDHPANRGRLAGTDFTHVINDAYRRCDAIIGKALEFSDEETLFIALSDHGFNSFERGVHVNKWLLDNGFLALETGIEPGEAAGDFLRHVDWARTRAYAIGLSGIYLNLKGREAQGIVLQEDAGSVKAAVAQGLTGLIDPARANQIAINRVQAREAVYHGAHVEEAPDLLVDFAPGYRVSWSSSMGGIAESQLEDNIKKWSGDHIIDPDRVPGVLFMSRPFRGEGARLLDLAPSILNALGVSKGPAMEGESLFS